MKHTKENLVNYLHECLTLEETQQEISKSELKKYSREELEHVLEHFELTEKFDVIPDQEKFFVIFLADAKSDKDNSNNDSPDDQSDDEESYGYSQEWNAIDEKTLRTYLKEHGYKVVNICPKKGHHLCKYCGQIAEGSNTDLLCNDCHELFGHTRYSEL